MRAPTLSASSEFVGLKTPSDMPALRGRPAPEMPLNWALVPRPMRVTTDQSRSSGRLVALCNARSIGIAGVLAVVNCNWSLTE